MDFHAAAAALLLAGGSQVMYLFGKFVSFVCMIPSQHPPSQPPPPTSTHRPLWEDDCWDVGGSGATEGARTALLRPAVATRETSRQRSRGDELSSGPQTHSMCVSRTHTYMLSSGNGARSKEGEWGEGEGGAGEGRTDGRRGKWVSGLL